MNEIKHISQTNNSIRVFCICPNTFFINDWNVNIYLKNKKINIALKKG